MHKVIQKTRLKKISHSFLFDQKSLHIDSFCNKSALSFCVFSPCCCQKTLNHPCCALDFFYCASEIITLLAVIRENKISFLCCYQKITISCTVFLLLLYTWILDSFVVVRKCTFICIFSRYCFTIKTSHYLLLLESVKLFVLVFEH